MSIAMMANNLRIDVTPALLQLALYLHPGSGCSLLAYRTPRLIAKATPNRALPVIVKDETIFHGNKAKRTSIAAEYAGWDKP